MNVILSYCGIQIQESQSLRNRLSIRRCNKNADDRPLLTWGLNHTGTKRGNAFRIIDLWRHLAHWCLGNIPLVPGSLSTDTKTSRKFYVDTVWVKGLITQKGGILTIHQNASFDRMGRFSLNAFNLHIILLEKWYIVFAINISNTMTTCNMILTHLPLDKMAAISQMIFSDTFSWMKMYKFWLRFRWILFLRVQLTIFQHWFR